MFNSLVCSLLRHVSPSASFSLPPWSSSVLPFCGVGMWGPGCHELAGQPHPEHQRTLQPCPNEYCSCQHRQALQMPPVPGQMLSLRRVGTGLRSASVPGVGLPGTLALPQLTTHTKDCLKWVCGRAGSSMRSTETVASGRLVESTHF